MDPASIAFTIGTLFLTKALEKSGEKFGEATIAKIGQAIDHIRHHSPETAGALAAADPKVLNLGTATLEQIPDDPIFAELAAALDAERNATFQEKFEALKAGRVVQVMAMNIQATNLKAGNLRQTAPEGSETIDQTMVKNVKVTGDIDLGDLTQEA